MALSQKFVTPFVYAFFLNQAQITASRREKVLPFFKMTEKKGMLQMLHVFTERNHNVSANENIVLSLYFRLYRPTLAFVLEAFSPTLRH